MRGPASTRWLRRLAAPGGRPVPAESAGPPPSSGESPNGAAEGSLAEGLAPQPGAPARFARELAPVQPVPDAHTVSRLLFGRLSATDVQEVEAAIAADPQLQAYYGGADPRLRIFLALCFGVWLRIPAVLDKVGLGAEQPPEDVHAMARGPLAAAGGLYEADMVAEALASVGVDIASAAAALDFGCSSGRVVRVLSAAYPEVRWHGCDPNAPAIAWAQRAYPRVNLFVSGDEPPLTLPDGSLDLVCAISIWSHFAPELGLRWFDEMRRLIRPGGHLVCTTHGFTSVDFYVKHSQRTPEQSDEIVGALYRGGWWYAQEFGETGDWGVVNPGWGTAFLSPEWLLAQLCPDWRVLQFAPGRNQDNQDVYVLQRV